MSDFYTVIALVLSVSGATYGAIAGLHHLLKDRIEKWGTDVRLAKERCHELGGPKTKKCSSVCHAFFSLMRWIWVLTLAIPVLLFCYYSFYSAFRALHAFAASQANTPGVPPFAASDMNSQMNLLSIVVWADAGCIAVAVAMIALMVGGLAVIKLFEGMTQENNDGLQRVDGPIHREQR